MAPVDRVLVAARVAAGDWAGEGMQHGAQFGWNLTGQDVRTENKNEAVN